MPGRSTPAEIETPDLTFTGQERSSSAVGQRPSPLPSHEIEPEAAGADAPEQPESTAPGTGSLGQVGVQPDRSVSTSTIFPKNFNGEAVGVPPVSVQGQQANSTEPSNSTTNQPIEQLPVTALSSEGLEEKIRGTLQNALTNSVNTLTLEQIQAIEIEALDNIVVLRGTVQSVEEKSAVERAVRALPGIGEIKNDLRVEKNDVQTGNAREKNPPTQPATQNSSVRAE
ncbi:MAG: BON domain-containing protein [Verrucomicrobiota bacterium]|nr:BON domain-containing protein [Verrucomicrobiota bacterium]